MRLYRIETGDGIVSVLKSVTGICFASGQCSSSCSYQTEDRLFYNEQICFSRFSLYEVVESWWQANVKSQTSAYYLGPLSTCRGPLPWLAFLEEYQACLGKVMVVLVSFLLVKCSDNCELDSPISMGKISLQLLLRFINPQHAYARGVYIF